ncbi:uncharacterized protein LOC111985840 [Quercus suber]|uniref:uncharacterized protein LOC111985840 n=1 Tax=Quercus suber TaxID=58331 RepID=UPI0032DFFC22
MSKEGEWVHDEMVIKEVIRNGFSELYTSFLSCSALEIPAASPWQARLFDEDQDSIDKVVSEEEIKNELWSLKAFKAPGPNGLHAGFFQCFWLIVGTLVKEEIMKIFSNMEVLEEVNRTLIILIPKILRPETLSNYHPIILCNTIYKIVSKILVARLRPLLGNLISLLQIAFVPGRRGTNNAIISQELIHIISRKRESYKTGYELYLNSFQLDLGQLIEEECSKKRWKLVWASKSGLAFSHLFFADDLVIFTKANQANCLVIREVLHDFCSKSEQLVNGAKSRVYFSPNVEGEARESLYDILGFQSTPNLGKYLGWKANLLSLAGRAVLIKHVSSTIPNYVMQCNQLPGKIIVGIDRVNRNFLWGSLDTTRKVHWMGWEKVTQPKKEGGLGIQSTRVIQGPIPCESVDLKVRNVVSANGWDWSAISFELSDSIKLELEATPFVVASRGCDKLG